jgi:hypothetical protein
MNDKRIVFFFLLSVLNFFILPYCVFKIDLSMYRVSRWLQAQNYCYTFSNYIFLTRHRFDLRNGTAALIGIFVFKQWLILLFVSLFRNFFIHRVFISFTNFVFFLRYFFSALGDFISKEIAMNTNLLMYFSTSLCNYKANTHEFNYTELFGSHFKIHTFHIK